MKAVFWMLAAGALASAALAASVGQAEDNALEGTAGQELGADASVPASGAKAVR